MAVPVWLYFFPYPFILSHSSPLPLFSLSNSFSLPQVGLYGQEFSEDVTPPTFLSACPVEAGLVDLPGEEEGPGGEPTERLTLADTIAPHWFSPPEGSWHKFPISLLAFIS